MGDDGIKAERTTEATEEVPRTAMDSMVFRFNFGLPPYVGRIPDGDGLSKETVSRMLEDIRLHAHIVRDMANLAGTTIESIARDAMEHLYRTEGVLRMLALAFPGQIDLCAMALEIQNAWDERGEQDREAMEKERRDAAESICELIRGALL